MLHALSDVQISLLRLASRTQLPSSLTHKQFLDIRLLQSVSLIEPSPLGFGITTLGSEYLRRIAEDALERESPG